jgi:hypothetical protein
MKGEAKNGAAVPNAGSDLRNLDIELSVHLRQGRGELRTFRNRR